MTELHPLLTTPTNVKRAGGVMTLDALLSAHIEFRTRLPMGWQQQYQFTETHAKNIYLCQSIAKEYITCQTSCTCGSWTEQVSLSEWLLNEGIEYSPICKHQMMLAIGLSNQLPRKPAHSILWELDGDKVKVWATRDNRTVTELKDKTFDIRDFATNKVKSIAAGWNFIRKNQNGLEVLQTTSRGRRR
jgi:hypothetical protein